MRKITVQITDTLEKLVAFLKLRLVEHKGYIVNKDETKATRSHFNLSGHNLGHLKATILEQINKNSEEYRKERESFYIRKFNTFYMGLNKQK